MYKPKEDSLGSWREEVGLPNSKGERTHYAGGTEGDPTVDAILAYLEEEKRRKQAETQKQQNPDDTSSKTPQRDEDELTNR